MSGKHTCKHHYRELISRYIDGDLDADERQELLNHLGSCQECRKTLEAYRSIGSQIRSMTPVHPPQSLRRDIYADTIEARPRRVQYITSRVGYSLAAVAAILLVFVVAIYLIVAGYQQSIDPEVVSSNPSNNVVWPLHRPIEVSFNKEMDRESVESALSISPASERDRLNISWDGNTLVIGQNQLLKPGSSYSLSITGDAEDRYGNQLGQPFSLQFETSSTVTQIETPEAAPSATATPTATPEATSTEDSEATSTSEPQLTPTDAAPDPTKESPENDPTDGNGSGSSDGQSQPPPGPTATPTPLPPEPTPTPEPTSTPAETPPTPTVTPTEAQPPPTVETREPTPTATPDTIPVTGSIGNIYWGQDEVRDRLGDPLSHSTTTDAVELDFQHGAMILRRDQQQVYLLEAVGVWSAIPYVDGELPDPVEGSEEGTWEPGGPLGLIWANEPWIRDSLGLALEPEGREFETIVQQFQSGVMIQSSTGQIYVLYATGTWELYSDPGSN